MRNHGRHSPTVSSLRASFWIFLSLAGVACGMTLLFLAMRAVMEVGGACADGNPPYMVATPCPKGIPLAMFGGVWGGALCLGIYLWQSRTYQIPNFVALAWSALFLSLGWNFVEFGWNPPGSAGLEWGWLVCGVLFGLMGGAPLVLVVPPVIRSFRGFEGMKLPGRGAGGGAGRPHATALVLERSLKRDRDGVPRVRESVPAPPRFGPRPQPEARSSTAPAPPGAATVVELLERLAALHRTGALDDAEYKAAKDRLLKQGVPG